MSDPLVLHCECGATRAAPPGIRTMACVNCGRAMHPPLPPASTRPPIWMLATAALFSQTASAAILCLAVAWMVTNGSAPAEMLVCGGAALLGVLAGGIAYRGTLPWLLLAGTVDAVIAGGSLAGTGALAELDRVQSVIDPVLLGQLIAGFAGFSAMLCAFAIPQARRYTSWQRRQLRRAAAAQRL